MTKHLLLKQKLINFDVYSFCTQLISWTLAIAIVFLSIVATGYVEKQSMQVGSEVTEGASAAQQQEASKTKIPNFNENAKPQAQPQQQPAQPAQPAK